MQALSAYSVPPAPVADGEALVFDRNALVEGSAISHNANSAEFVIEEEGIYYASYSASVFTLCDKKLPAANLISFSLDGTMLSGGTSQEVFTHQNQTAMQASALLIRVTSVPAKLTLVSTGGTFAYSNLTMNIFRL